jgi:tRNA A-37 threonylcarbamoyl transferase component Bud32
MSGQKQKTPTGDPTPPLPRAPGASRVDTISDEFAALLARRPLNVGDIIANRYRLVEKLGGGAFGDVFVGENLAIGRRVAIKVLKPEMLIDPEFRRRFQHEAEAIAAIDHRNVVRFLDLLVGDPTFLVMEYAAGPTLAEVLSHEKKLEPVRALNIARRLGWALEAAHRAGVVHRDVKPANVILTPDPELGEEPKLIDFGLAKLTTIAPEDQLTRAGQILGTPYYISPEQIANEPVDARTDEYALACVIYHMIAGRPPFEASDEVQVLYQHRHLAATPLRHYAPEAPAALEEVLQRALAKDPAARFPSLREMVEALGRVDRRRRAPQEPPASPPARGRLKIATVAVLGTLVFVLGMVALFGTPGRTQIIVTTDPAGASLDIDGRTVGEVTPLAAPLQPGRHHVRARLGERSVEEVVSVERNQRLAMHLSLPEATRPLHVETIPSSAQLFIDGHLVGTTPMDATINDGDFHEVRVEKSGYETARTAITPEDRSPQVSLRLSAERQPRGTLWIDANRASSVFLDGNDTGLVTPTIGMRVPPGSHRIELRDASLARSPTAQVQIHQGETLHITLDFGK